VKLYMEAQPQLSTIHGIEGTAVLEFGTNWCGYCQAAAPLIEQEISNMPNVKHVKVEDGPGRPLGRTFRVKLWPTLVFLKDGQEQARLVRPTDTNAIRSALNIIE
jgi:thioredoxin 1